MAAIKEILEFEASREGELKENRPQFVHEFNVSVDCGVTYSYESINLAM